jgi:hypothetical protein
MWQMTVTVLAPDAVILNSTQNVYDSALGLNTYNPVRFHYGFSHFLQSKQRQFFRLPRGRLLLNPFCPCPVRVFPSLCFIPVLSLIYT